MYIVGAFWRVKAGFDFSSVLGSLFSPSWEGRWPPSLVNSSKNQGRALSIQVRFLFDSGSIFGLILGAFSSTFGDFLGIRFRFPFSGAIGSPSCLILVILEPFWRPAGVTLAPILVTFFWCGFGCRFGHLGGGAGGTGGRAGKGKNPIVLEGSCTKVPYAQRYGIARRI